MTNPKERRIIFPGPDAGAKIRAVLKGDLTRHSWPMKPRPEPAFCSDLAGDMVAEWMRPGPYSVGQRLWCAEAWLPTYQGLDCLYRADKYSGPFPNVDPWRPSSRMPRWASRIDLEVTGVGVQRVQEISKQEAVAEASVSHPIWCRFAISEYAKRWDATYAKRGLGWDTNLWVWWATFKRVKP